MGFFDKMALRRELKGLVRNAVGIEPAPEAESGAAESRIGGRPDLPEGFVWPRFSARVRGKDVSLPLAFIAQVNLAEAAPWDKEGLLPKKGLLSFFYEARTQPSGMDPADKEGARVFYFEDASALFPAVLSDDMPAQCAVPGRRALLSCRAETPCWEEHSLLSGRETDSALYNQVRSAVTASGTQTGDIKLLGYADVIQDAMQRDCQLISMGHDLSNGPAALTSEQDAEAAAAAADWILLFQCGTLRADGFELMFGDMGRVYFYIRTRDLAERRFGNAVAIMQC